MIMHTDTTTLSPTFDHRIGTCYAGPDAADVAAFQRAMASYKQRSGRQFPTWSEVLEVLRETGYAKPGSADAPGGRPKVRINVEDDRRERIGVLLATHGGVPTGPPARPLFGFDSESVRGEAMDLARCHFGWTCVDPA